IGVAGFSEKWSVRTAGRCSAVGSDRLCDSDLDCAISGFPDQGTCLGAGTAVIDARSRGAVVENNTFRGPFDGSSSAIILTQSVAPLVKGNRVIGNGTSVGLYMDGAALETQTVVTRNLIQGTSFAAIDISKGNGQDAANGFGARISLNDIILHDAWSLAG